MGGMAAMDGWPLDSGSPGILAGSWPGAADGVAARDNLAGAG